jgi:hypothetical protein
LRQLNSMRPWKIALKAYLNDYFDPY